MKEYTCPLCKYEFDKPEDTILLIHCPECKEFGWPLMFLDYEEYKKL